MTDNYSPAREESSALFLQGEMEAIITTETGMKGAFAAQFAASMVRGLQMRVGGQRIYIPALPKNSERDAQIKAEFMGNNRAEICRKFEISPSRLYQIVNR